MLVLAGSFSYTSRVSFSEESLLHSPCCFQWAVLGTLMFIATTHACPTLALARDMRLLTSSSSMREGRGLTPHWSKTLRKNQSHWKRETTAWSVRLQRGTPCIHSCTRHRLCWYQDGKHGPIGAQRPLTQVTWQVRAYWLFNIQYQYNFIVSV